MCIQNVHVVYTHIDIRIYMFIFVHVVFTYEHMYTYVHISRTTLDNCQHYFYDHRLHGGKKA